MAASVLSVNGELHSLLDRATLSEPRSEGYTALEIGKPIIVQYLYFFLKHPRPEKKNEIMISTFIKAKETKKRAAETVNYFNNTMVFDSKKQLRISDFGAKNYGHKLCYYAKSYLGESLYFTTKIMEIDKVNKSLIQALTKGIGTVASIPVFAEFLPYAAGTSVAVPLFGKLLDLFNKDDSIIESHDIDFRFNLENVRRLQSGRVVCVPDKEDDELLGGEYRLNRDNKLINTNTNEEYTDSSYFVMQIDSKPNKELEGFDYFLGAADLLKLTNRKGDHSEAVRTFVDIFKGYNDIEAICKIEELSIDIDEPKIKEKIKAVYKSMSSNSRRLYQDRVKELTGS